VLQDCPDIANEIQNTRPNHASLIKLTKDYHEKMCNSESCIIYERGNTSLKVKFGILVGFSQNQYDFGGELISNYSSSYQIGAALKISNFLMFNEHLSAKINVLFENSKSYTLSLQDGTSYCITTYNNVVYTFNKTNYGTNGFPYLPSMKIDLNVLDLKL